MASIINSTTTAGVTVTGDNSGSLQLATNNGTTAVTISTGQVATFVNDAVINGLTVGKGGGAVSSNTAFGVNALTANEAGGTNNTAIGNAALDSNTTGDYNTALGDSALAANTTGLYNTAVGYQAKNVGTGGYNSCFGAGTGTAFSTGAENTLVGYFAGGSLTTGNKNAFFGGAQGNGSGGLITTGSSNTIIGSYSGNAGGLDIRTATGYIVHSNGDGDWKAYFNGSAGGWFQVSNSSSWATTSDQRIKENIVDVTNGLAKIVALRPVEFDYKIGEKAHDVGFIAQEYETVFPEQIIEQSAGGEEIKALTNNEPVKGIQQNLVPYLVKAIQDLNAKIEAQAVRIAELEGAK
jgi:hypothetical protein